MTNQHAASESAIDMSRLPEALRNVEEISEEEFRTHWGQSPAELLAECERENAGKPREIFYSDDEFIAALEREIDQ